MIPAGNTLESLMGVGGVERQERIAKIGVGVLRCFKDRRPWLKTWHLQLENRDWFRLTV